MIYYKQGGDFMKKLISLILVVMMITVMTSCNIEKKTRYEASFLVLFDTITEIVAYTNTKEEFNQYSQLIYDGLEEYHKLYDIYKDYEGINNIKTINDNAGKTPVKVDKKIIDLLLIAKDAYGLTNGKVNVAFGAVLTIWHDFRTQGIDNPQKATLPPLVELEEAKKHTDINKIIIDEKASTVYLEDAQMSLDVGAMAKGYATEQVAKSARDNGYTSGLLSVGGNVRAIGNKGIDDTPWVVGIQNPDTESKVSNLYTLNLKNLSLVTSGNYQRYYTVNGKQYHHIIDPETLMPANYFTAVSVICEDSGTADLLSTAIYNMPFEQGKALIESLDNTEALWIFINEEIKYSENFQELIH
jgi:FAD:protein FMN transferase